MVRSVKAVNSSLSERKHLAIQEAGTAVFLRLGYGAASMDLIAAEANVSKQTIYNHFHSKDELFKAIITDMTTTLMAPLSMREARQSTPERLLHSFGRDFLTLMVQPSSLALYRLIVAESARFPELGGDLYTVGPGRLIGILADYLAWETKNGRLAVVEPERGIENGYAGAYSVRKLATACSTRPSSSSFAGCSATPSRARSCTRPLSMPMNCSDARSGSTTARRPFLVSQAR